MNLHPSKNKTVYDMINDTHKEYLWGLRFIGTEKTWLQVDENKLNQIKISIIDSGIDAAHEDLANVVLPGYNFILNNNDTSDSHSHGTNIAGVIGAIKNNNIGVAGVASGVKMIPLKIAHQNIKANKRNMIRAIEWSIENNVDIINISMGYQKDAISSIAGDYSVYEEGEREIIKSAMENGIAIVSAVGNNSSPTLDYPAQYPGVISVASFGIIKNPLSIYVPQNSNGWDTNTIFAPGEFIFTTSAGNGYEYTCGSSFACGYVTGALALLKAISNNLTPLQISDILINTRTKENVIGGGEISCLDVDAAADCLRFY